MSIELPCFDKGYCIALTVCGQLKLSNHPQKKKHKNEVERIARYRTKKGMAFFRACHTGKKGEHLHVDCVLSSFFRGDFKPKPTHKKTEVLEVINNLLTTEIESNIEACFDVPFLKIPGNSMIRLLSGDQKSVDMSLRLTTAELTLTGAPLDKIQWSILKTKTKDLVHIMMQGNTTLTLSETYLSECYDWINKQFYSFIFGRKKDGKS